MAFTELASVYFFVQDFGRLHKLKMEVGKMLT